MGKDRPHRAKDRGETTPRSPGLCPDWTGGDWRVECGLITNVYSLSKPLPGTNSVPGPEPGTGDVKTNQTSTLALKGPGKGGCVYTVHCMTKSQKPGEGQPQAGVVRGRTLGRGKAPEGQ